MPYAAPYSQPSSYANLKQVLGGIADTVAQSITAFKMRSRSLPATTNTRTFIASDGVEMEDMNEKQEPTETVLSPKFYGPQPFDFERLTRFMAYGFIMAPIQWKWFSALNRWFPITSTSGTLPAIQRVAMDQFIFAPLGLTCFFTFMTVAEGGGPGAVKKKFEDVYMPTLRANYMVWPAVQMLNFRILPIQFQIPFVSTIGIAWTAYLSLANASEEDEVL